MRVLFIILNNQFSFAALQGVAGLPKLKTPSALFIGSRCAERSIL
jgi:hypothetical protein